MQYDLREFVTWIVSELEPAVRLDDTAGSYTDNPSDRNLRLYGAADMACVFHTIGALDVNEKQRREWSEHCNAFQSADGMYRADPPNHSVLHNTAFMLGAMNLLGIKPEKPLEFVRQYDTREKLDTWLQSFDWQRDVYTRSHDGAGLASAAALAPGTVARQWFDWYFDLCDAYFDENNGMMGRGKPAGGDTDQIGGTFHYIFVYDFFRRPVPYPQQRIDAILGLQLPDGLWHEHNTWWMTLDAVYMMTRAVRQCGHRIEDVRAAVRKTLSNRYDVICDAKRREQQYLSHIGPHSATATLNLFAEAQQFLGSKQVVTDWPLQLVLDRRPFI